jgi:hypothetical protein
MTGSALPAAHLSQLPQSLSRVPGRPVCLMMKTTGKCDRLSLRVQLPVSPPSNRYKARAATKNVYSTRCRARLGNDNGNRDKNGPASEVLAFVANHATDAIREGLPNTHRGRCEIQKTMTPITALYHRAGGPAHPLLRRILAKRHSTRVRRYAFQRPSHNLRPWS